MGRIGFLALCAAAMLPVTAAGGERIPTAADTRAVWMALSTAPEAERPAWRWRLGRDYAARGLYAEADGVLRVLAADSPERAATREFRLLHAEVMTALGEGVAALKLLDAPVLEGLSAACLARLAAAARPAQPATVRANATCAEPAIAALPEARRTRHRLAAARAEIALGDMAAARAMLDRITRASPSEAGEASYWRGVIARQRGQLGLAADHLRTAAAGTHPAAAVRAKAALVEMQVADRTMAPAAALDRLESLRFTWRGGTAERDLLITMGRIADDAAEARRAFGYYAIAAQYFPAGYGETPLRDVLAARFAAIFADGGVSLQPLEAFALFWDYREFAPQGPAADRMVRRLADRLARLGLDAQAASLLEHQVYNRLEGSARGLVAVRLADLLNNAGRHAQALTVLAATQNDSVPANAADERIYVEAAALIGTGRAAEAKALLAEVGGDRARRLRGEAAWSVRDWNGVIAALERDLPATERAVAGAALTPLLRLTVAAAMEGDEALLRQLRQRYLAALANSDAGRAFDILTGDPAAVPAAQLRAALAAAAARASASAAPSPGKAA